MNKCREDCYFYYESQEMSAYVPNCSFDAQYEYGFCPCSENCEHYISKKEAHKLIKKIVRCKDCSHGELEPWNKTQQNYRCLKSEYEGCYDYHEGDWFCAGGKRR